MHSLKAERLLDMDIVSVCLSVNDNFEPCDWSTWFMQVILSGLTEPFDWSTRFMQVILSGLTLVETVHESLNWFYSTVQTGTNKCTVVQCSCTHSPRVNRDWT